MISLGAAGAAAKTVAGFLSPRGWKILGIVAGTLAVIGLFLWALDSYGDREFAAGRQEGQAMERQAWEMAEQKYQQKHEQAQTEATAKAVERETKHAAQVEAEREKINVAIAEERSPLDVLFPSSL